MENSSTQMDLRKFTWQERKCTGGVEVIFIGPCQYVRIMRAKLIDMEAVTQFVKREERPRKVRICSVCMEAGSGVDTYRTRTS